MFQTTHLSEVEFVNTVLIESPVIFGFGKIILLKLPVRGHDALLLVAFLGIRNPNAKYVNHFQMLLHQTSRLTDNVFSK